MRLSECINIAYIGGSRGWVWNLMSGLATCSMREARLLFKEMVENTSKYLPHYDLSTL